MAAVDRISELPEPILHRILSFLSQKQAIQTSALSKTWRHVGPTGPKIELREGCFKKSGRASFLSVLGKTLQRYNQRNLSVHEFILEMSSSESNSNDRHYQVIDSEWKSVLDKGIQMLLTNMGVKRFDFSVPNYVADPSFVFRAEFLTELCLSQCKFMTTTVANDHHQPLFKGLKRLSLTRVHIKDETLEKIVRSCSLIEYLLVSDCVGLKTIPLTIFQAEFLTELHLRGCIFYAESGLVGHNLNFTTPSYTQLLLIKRLKTLSLEKVYVQEETLEKIMCSCPLIERLLLRICVGLKNIQLIKNTNNLKHFSGSFYRVNIQSIEIDAPAIETISIVDCPNWYGHDKYFFPRLKSLCLNRVKLSAEFFESFSFNFPSLEDLKLVYCYGLQEIQEIQLTACSIKRLVLTTDSKKQIKATIYAPNIHFFKFFGYQPPRVTFHSEAAREWKSNLDLRNGIMSDNKDLKLTWLLQLIELLNSLRESEIYAHVHRNCFESLKVEDTYDAGFCKPVPLEHVHVKGGYAPSPFPDLLNGLFLICRPRYIGMNLSTINPITDLKREKDKLVEFVETFKSCGYLWERDLEEISMQFWDENSKGWHTVPVDGTSFPGFTTSPTIIKIRFLVKWIN